MADQSIDQFKGQPRLPKFAAPKRYDLKLKLDLSACKFIGTVEIELQITDQTKFIVLNAADLSVENSSGGLTSLQSNQVVRPSEVLLMEEDEILVLQFDDFLPIGDGVLSIGFKGTLACLDVW